MMKFLFFFFLIYSSLFGDFNMNKSLDAGISVNDINTIEKTILKEAILAKNYNAISTVAVSFYALSLQPDFKGNRKKLQARSIELLELAHNNNNITSSLYLVTTFFASKPKYIRKIAKEVIQRSFNDDRLAGDKMITTISLLYASSVLDNESTNTKDVNFAIEALNHLQQSSPEINFYLAWLFRALGSTDVADAYLNESCHMAKLNSKIYDYCFSDSVVKKDDTESKVINKNCNKDISRRCK